MIDPIAFTVSDDAVALTAGAGKFTWRMPDAMTPVYVRGTLTTPQTSGPKLSIDIKRAGVSVFSTPLTFDNGKKSTVNAAVPAVLLGTAFAMDDEFTVDVSIGDGTAKGLKVTIYDDISGIVLPPPDDPPPPPTGSWHTVAAPALGATSASLATFSMRHVLGHAALTGLTAPSKVRVTLKGLAAAACTVNRLFVGQTSAAPNAAALAPLTFSGSNSVTIPAGQDVVSDEITLAIDIAKDLMVTFEAAGSVSYGSAASGWSRYFKAAQNESDDINVTGYAAYNTQLLISKIEVFA